MTYIHLGIFHDRYNNAKNGGYSVGRTMLQEYGPNCTEAQLQTGGGGGRSHSSLLHPPENGVWLNIIFAQLVSCKCDDDKTEL